nr:MAG: hypothetical protein E4H34_00925 [Hyphomicrobiales bacterium]
MRFAGWIVGYALLFAGMLTTGNASAQNWIEYENRDVGFNINFPAEPDIEDTEYVSPTGEILPAQLFSATEGESEYRVTVVDFSSRPGEQHIAILQAADAMRASGEVVYEVVSDLDEIFGPQFYVVRDGGREVLATIVFFRERLFITEGSVPPGSAPPSQFQQSMGLVNADGSRPNGSGQNEDRLARQRAFEEQQRLREQ